MIQHLFPTPIWKVSCMLDYKNILEQVCNEHKINPTSRSISNIAGWQSNNLNIDTSFYTNYFMQHIVPALGIVSPNQISVPAIWGNINNAGAFNLLHDHIDGNNIISFVHYLKLPHGTSSISFRSDRPSLKFWNIPTAQFNELNSQDVIINVLEGDVVFFPSWLEHYTMPNATALDRVSLAGNIEIEYEKSTRL